MATRLDMASLLEQIQEKWKAVFRRIAAGKPRRFCGQKARKRFRDYKSRKLLSREDRQTQSNPLQAAEAEHLLNVGISARSSAAAYRTTQVETISRLHRYERQETMSMMIFVLAVAMTVAMLIATVFALHQEAQQFRLTRQQDRFSGFGH